MKAPRSPGSASTSTCRPTSPPRTSPHRLTALGLKLEALERPGADITGPLVVGRVLTMERRAAEERQDDQLVPVDVGDANGTGEPQGIVCGAHNFARRRPRRRRRCPAACCPAASRSPRARPTATSPPG